MWKKNNLIYNKPFERLFFYNQLNVTGTLNILQFLLFNFNMGDYKPHCVKS